MTAATSLASMAKDVPLSRSAMLQLTDLSYGDDDVRALATRMSISMPVGIEGERAFLQ
jgi:hypothetical protein